MSISPINLDGVSPVVFVGVQDGPMPDITSHEEWDAAVADVLTSLTRKENQMGGSITYRDGRELCTWYIGYEYVDVPTTFEPLPKVRRRAWSIW